MDGGVESLSAEIRRSIAGETWFGPSLSELLQDVDAREASTNVNGVAHSIWEIAGHCSVWARYATYRFGGGAPRDLDEENWPAGGGDKLAWSQARDALFAAYEGAASTLVALPPDALDAADPSTPIDANGDPVTLRRLAAGLAQHAAYHAGQIASIKALARTESAPS